jgi:hypothetical protein
MLFVIKGIVERRVPDTPMKRSRYTDARVPDTPMLCSRNTD